jgi:prolyl-tRNA synthetase
MRLELGKKDFDKLEVRCCKRNDGQKFQVKQDNLVKEIVSLLDSIHTEMYDKALASRKEHLSEVDNWKDFMAAISKRDICMAPWCNIQACEVEVKDRSKEESLAAMEQGDDDEVTLTGSAKTLCIPFDQPKLEAGAKCFACGKPATCKALWGRSY